MVHPPVAPLNGLTVDVEDWVQSVFDSSAPLTDSFVRNTHFVLETLASHRVRGTFFVLGLAAEKSPDVVRAIRSAGHEVQSHGYGHRPVHTLTPRQFREDLEHSKHLLEDLSGQAIVGYRAPAFSIALRNLWAFDILVECGFTYDSSVFPVRTRRYGIAGVPRVAHRIRTPSGNTLIEVPVASYRFMGCTLPLGGGGYFRLFPHAIIRHAIAKANRGSTPVSVYFHPYEFNRTEIARLADRIPRHLQIHQTMGRRGLPRKLGRLLQQFRFGPLQEVIASLSPIPSRDCYTPCTLNDSALVTAAR